MYLFSEPIYAEVKKPSRKRGSSKSSRKGSETEEHPENLTVTTSRTIIAMSLSLSLPL